MEQLPFHRRITVRLIAFFGLLALMGTLAGAYVSIQLARHEFFNVMERQSNSTFKLAENSLDIIGQMARSWAFHLAEDSQLWGGLSGSHEVISQTVENMRAEARADTVIVLDRQGRVLHHSAFDEKDGESLMSWQIVRQAIDEGQSSYAIIEESGNFIVYGSGMVPQSKASGSEAYVVLAGFRISDRLVTKLSEDTGIDLTFVRRTAVMSSSFNTEEKKLVDLPIPYLDYQTLYNDPKLVSEVRIDGQQFYASVRKLHMLDPAMDGSLLLTYSGQELDQIVGRLQREYLWLYAAGMLLLVLFIWRISLRLMRPLRRLADRVARVTKGDLTPTEIDRRDEIGSIASSFNDLLGELAASKQKIEQHAENLERLVEKRTEELRTANHELMKQATHDALTGLPNRKLFNDRVQQALSLAHRTQASMAVMFIDLDRFKWVNDTFGHAAGDELLKEVARRLQPCLREGDTIARLGGDEFTVVLSQSGTISNIEEVVNRLLTELTTPFDLPGAADTRISGSIGIAVYPEHADTAAKLLLHADHAMYRAKDAGRATYRFWEPEASSPPAD